jgi:orotate phosphoribosyltransferase
MENASELYARLIAAKAVDINAITVSPDEPFLWASGTHNPIYNDNRLHLFHPNNRRLIACAMAEYIDAKGIRPEFIAGTSTAGISPGTTLADMLNLPFVYVRDKPKDHGMKNQIEGISAERDLGGRVGIVYEDLISTGGSSAKTVQAVRNANGKVIHCMCIFSYDLPAAKRMFSGEITYDSKDPAQPKLDPACKIDAMLTYPQLLEFSKDRFTPEQLKALAEWREDQPNWGANHGFPPVKK